MKHEGNVAAFLRKYADECGYSIHLDYKYNLGSRFDIALLGRKRIAVQVDGTPFNQPAVQTALDVILDHIASLRRWRVFRIRFEAFYASPLKACRPIIDEMRSDDGQ